MQVTIDQFKVLMEEALARTRGIPRSYLLPSPAQRLEDAQLTFKPRITQRSEVGAPRQPALSLLALNKVPGLQALLGSMAHLVASPVSRRTLTRGNCL